jgi:hypothetical protein
MRNFLLGILFMMLVGGIGFAAYQYGKTGGVKLPSEGAITPTITQEVFAPISVAPTIETQNDTELIRAALFKKNNWPADDTLKVTVSTNDGTYASGTACG